MGVMKKALMYSMGMAAAGIAGYEIGRMMKSRPAREMMAEPSGMAGRAGMEPRDPRDYRSIYGL
jgi:hypothetical protein